VLDVDTQHGGASTLKALAKEHGKLPETAQVLTGGGGAHAYFQHPGVEVRNSAGKLGPGLDIRGDGGYIIAPPSVHENGRVYKWLKQASPAELPAWLLENAEKRRNGAAAKVAEIIPEGQRRAAMLSVAGKLKRAELSGEEILPTLRALNQRCRPPLDERELESVALKGTIEPDAAIPTVIVYDGPTRALGDVVAAFQKWLHLPDLGALYVVLAAVIANRLPGDPFWLLLVAASSSGKTEIILAIGGLEEVTPAATMTEASLLSGTPKKDHTAGASGGLLIKVGAYGILTLKDFGSVLSMNRDTRAAVLAALR
jgi:hypothetical protein